MPSLRRRTATPQKCLPSLSTDECRRARGNSTCAELIQVHLILDVSHELAQRWAALLQRVLEPTCKRGVLSRARLALLSQRPPAAEYRWNRGRSEIRIIDAEGDTHCRRFCTIDRTSACHALRSVPATDVAAPRQALQNLIVNSTLHEIL